MNFLLRHIDSIIADYTASVPLAIYLRNYFKSYPKLGSRDRKALSHAAYLYYRYAKRLPAGLSVFEVIFNGIHHSGAGSSYLETMLLKYDDGLPTKIIPVAPTDPGALPELSDGITPEEWQDSFFLQPDVFIRVRDSSTADRLKEAGIPYTIPGSIQGNCLALPNGSSLEQVLPPSGYVVQDWASQQSIGILLENLRDARPDRLWDCCAGAGGKSLMIGDSLPGVGILATDIRKSILHNLLERFDRYGLPSPETAVADMSDAGAVQREIGDRRFDVILCDVPCSGSGTWARTPEQHFFFRAGSLKAMSDRQFQIASNTIPYLRPGGILAYITCSVFREENEAIVKRIAGEHELGLIGKYLINGISLHADSMFAAILKKNQP